MVIIDQNRKQVRKHRLKNDPDAYLALLAPYRADDQPDAFWLADMLRLATFPEGYIYPKEDRPVRDLLRQRGRLVQHRSAFIMSLQNTIARNGGGKLRAAKIKAKKTDHIILLLGQNEDLLFSSSVHKQIIDFFTMQIPSMEKKGLSRISLDSDYKGLRTNDKQKGKGNKKNGNK